MNVAIFGGSFNPPHFGHQIACLLLLETGIVDEIWLIPTYRHYFGKDLLPFEQRVVLCIELLRPFGGQAKVVVVEKELAEANPGSKSRMFDTLQSLCKRHPEHQFHLVIGADILAETDRWYRWDDIISMAPTIIFKRYGHTGGTLPAPPDVSSRSIRDALHRGESVSNHVPKSVLQCIDREGFYR